LANGALKFFMIMQFMVWNMLSRQTREMSPFGSGWVVNPDAAAVLA
jgi:hypothetical protein